MARMTRVITKPSASAIAIHARFTATSDLTFLALEAPLSLADASTTIAASPPGAAVAYETSSYYGRSELFGISLNSRPAIVSFDFPDRKAATDRLRMTVGSTQYSNNDLAVIAEVFDHSANRWVGLPMSKRSGPAQSDNQGMGRGNTRFDFSVEPTDTRWHPWLDTMLFRIRRQASPLPQLVDLAHAGI